MDANFEQKRCRNARGDTVPTPHSQTFFIPPDEVKEMKEYVDMARGGRQKRHDEDEDEDEDEVLPGLEMANYIYEGCTSRFLAAQDGNQKAEKSVFADTGLMALICRHDRILFMVNLKDAGERQYNALALIKRLFTELPSKWQLGLLYDIGCKLHKSIVKVCHNIFDSISMLNSACCSIPYSLNIQTECTLGCHVSMHLGIVLPANAAITPRNVQALDTQMGRGVREYGPIFKSKFQSSACQGYANCITSPEV